MYIQAETNILSNLLCVHRDFRLKENYPNFSVLAGQARYCCKYFIKNKKRKSILWMNKKWIWFFKLSFHFTWPLFMQKRVYICLLLALYWATCYPANMLSLFRNSHERFFMMMSSTYLTFKLFDNNRKDKIYNFLFVKIKKKRFFFIFWEKFYNFFLII